MYPLYAISGISGSGKTTLGRKLAEQLSDENIHSVDQDDFYLSIKPKVTLSDGKASTNWDSLSSLKETFPLTLLEMLQNSPVLVYGFALCREMLPVQPTVHIHLITADNPEDLKIRCKQARCQAKPFIDKERDSLMVEEIVIPFYHKMVRKSDITHLLRVFNDNGDRIPITTLVETMYNIFQQAKVPRKTSHSMDVSEPYYTLIREGIKPIEGRKNFAKLGKS